MNEISHKIKEKIHNGAILPKPRAKGDFVFLGWCESNGEEAIAYSIPSHKTPHRPFKKRIRVSELNKAYLEFQSSGELTREWFNTKLPKLAKEGACSFTTIGGLLILLGEAEYTSGKYSKMDTSSNTNEGQ